MKSLKNFVSKSYVSNHTNGKAIPVDINDVDLAD